MAPNPNNPTSNLDSSSEKKSENKSVDFFTPPTNPTNPTNTKVEATNVKVEPKVEPKVEEKVIYEQVFVEVPKGISESQRQQITMLASVSGMDSQQQFKFLDQLFKIIE